MSENILSVYLTFSRMVDILSLTSHYTYRITLCKDVLSQGAGLVQAVCYCSVRLGQLD